MGALRGEKCAMRSFVVGRADEIEWNSLLWRAIEVLRDKGVDKTGATQGHEAAGRSGVDPVILGVLFNMISHSAGRVHVLPFCFSYH